ncbi:deaminase reductase [Kitasatospora indigofera]|uniref:Deaminase reductase n=1 Tax=Kitasatospora indigofera TaxID=67307 RepID=A0A919KKH6_9ACTN|nr:dihydrofolate reductase family protein [Kitasatospora indigofera]GHH59904.1 deaminase reductase [Kitasatospora indigofera]
MAELTLTAFLTLDGVVQAPGGRTEDRAGGFDFGGWLVPFADEDLNRYLTEVVDRAGAFLLGRRTYEIFAGYWPQVTDPADLVATRLNSLPKYVASATLDRTHWAGSTLLGADVPSEVARLKEQHFGGEIQIHGSGALAQSLMALDLIDEYRLLVHPVVLGRGKRLFPAGGPPTTFRLEDSRTTGSGVAVHTYRPAGHPVFGSF